MPLKCGQVLFILGPLTPLRRSTPLKYIDKSLTHGEVVIKWGRFPSVYTFFAWIFLIVGAGFIMFIVKWTTEIAITNRRVIYKRGWIARKVEEISLTRLEEIGLNQSVMGRMLNYGKITCHGTGGQEIRLRAIASPLEFRKVLQEEQQKVET